MESMKTYVIGDTHSCYYEFEEQMKKINLNGEEDKLVMFGNFIDRGEQSWELMNIIKAMQKKYGSFI
jgi:serine/threonine protein phosphatase 1